MVDLKFSVRFNVESTGTKTTLLNGKTFNILDKSALDSSVKMYSNHVYYRVLTDCEKKWIIVDNSCFIVQL